MAGQCEQCHATGFQIRVDEHGVRTSVACPCTQEDRLTRLVQAARIPRRYDHCTLESFEIHDPSQGQALAAARAWLELWPATDSGLLFVGGPGTGKTHLVVALVRELMLAKGAHVLFYEQRELLKALQGTFDAGSTQRESEVLGPVQAAEVLVLDDLGAGRTTGWARDVMHDVIAHRYNEQRLLLITSNLPTGDETEAQRGVRQGQASPEGLLSLRDRLGDALMSRLYEMCRVVPVAGQDYRSGIKMHAKHIF
jgi:DNA replication protein DnaC